MHMNPQHFTIRESSPESDEAGALITALNAALDALCPEPAANHFELAAAEVGEGRGAFLLVCKDARAVGCGRRSGFRQIARFGP